MGLKVKQNNEWLNMSQEIQWKQNNKWHRHFLEGYPDHYVLNPSDWVLIEPGMILYQGDGTDPYTVIPEMVSKYQIVMVIIQAGAPIQGIATGSAKLNLTEYLFAGQSGFGGQNTIELDYFFTPEVTSMVGMFERSTYEYLDLRSFDTKECSNFRYMFAETGNLTTLDISSFDISVTDNISRMFRDSSVETVYVKNQQIADYLDIEGGKSGINFVIGSST